MSKLAAGKRQRRGVAEPGLEAREAARLGLRARRLQHRRGEIERHDLRTARGEGEPRGARPRAHVEHALAGDLAGQREQGVEIGPALVDRGDHVGRGRRRELALDRFVQLHERSPLVPCVVVAVARRSSYCLRHYS